MWSHHEPSRRWFETNRGARNDIAFADERVELDLHTGTHIDALGHTAIGDRMYNDFLVPEIAGNSGLGKLGVENIPPLVTRGVLVDLPASAGRELDPNEPITPASIQTALARQGSTLQAGDIVLLRTGWARYYGVDNARYVDSWPGIGLEAGEWLVQQRVASVGSDTMGLEVKPREGDSILWPVHQELLVRSGVYIIEQATLEEASSLENYVFACACLPIRFDGATASPLRLTALL
jgi:kynurenine formamidase